MKTKLICIMLLIVAATTVTIISCKKQDVQIEAFTKITDISSKIAKEWLINQKSSAKANEQFAIDSIMNVMNWTNGKAKDISKDQCLLYIPLSTKNNNIGISMYFNKTSQKIDSACLFLIDTKESFGDINAANILFSYLTKSKLSFTGSITSYTIFNKYKMGQGFENGILKYTKLEKNKAKGATNGQMQTNGVQCYNRYLITYYTDGTQTEEFLYTWCEGLDDCQTTGTVHLSDGQQEIKTFCAGGGGGVPPVVNECGMTEEEVTTILEGMTCTNANSLVYEGGSQNIDPATGFLSEAWNAKWNFQDVALPAVGTIKLDAWYVGKRYQESINSNWKWEMIEFNKVIPKRNIPCLEIIVDPVCSVSINQNKQYATSTIDGRCKAQITCFMTLQIGKPFDFHNYTNSIDAN